MKIIHISMADFNGAGLCAYRLCKAQRELGYDSRMVVLRKKHKDDFITQYGASTYFLNSIRHKLNKALGMADDLNECRALSRQHNRPYALPVSPIDLTQLQIIHDADVIHLHWVGDFLDFPSFFETFKAKPIVYTLHDQNLLYGISNTASPQLAGHWLEEKYWTLKKTAIQKAQRMGVVYLSRMTFNNQGDNPVLVHAHKRVIHNSVDSRLYRPYEKHAVRQRLGIGSEEKIFAFCACNIHEERKGLALLSDALAALHSDYKILAIGKNRSTAFGRNVIEVGRISDENRMSEMLSAADYFCMPSFEEYFAQAPLEAMSCGLPVIAFPCSGTEELISPENGVRCSDFTVDALKAGLVQALATDYRPAFIRQSVIDRFSPQQIAKENIDFYQSLME